MALRLQSFVRMLHAKKVLKKLINERNRGIRKQRLLAIYNKSAMTIQRQQRRFKHRNMTKE